jgi:WD40 repeat protein
LEKSQRNHQKALAKARALGLIGGEVVAPGYEKASISIKNPYKGLRSFQQGEEGEFFGREALVRQLLARLAEESALSRFLAVVGPSGCGKSSVLHAGLIPALKRGESEDSKHWVVSSMVPGGHPLDELEAALARASVKPGIDIMKQLLRDERGLQRVVGMILPENAELLLVVDQFEEVFSLGVDEDQRTHFLALLSNSIAQLHSRVRVVVALRADYYDRPLMSPTISELFRLRTEVVAPLTADELAQAICMPAKQAGVQVESGLVAAMVYEVSERPGLLPLMQYSLTELFDRRQDAMMTLAVYHQIGGIRGALTRHANVLYESLSNPQQALLRQIFLRLVKLGAEGEVLRRRVSLSELQAIQKDRKMVEELIDELANHRLITLDYDPATGSATVEIAHEALIREWDQLRAWLEDRRIDIRQQRLLAAATSDWREANRDPSFLLSGTHLIQFQTWAQTSQAVLNPVDNEFLTTSIREKQRHDRRRRIFRNLVIGTIAFVAIVMGGLTIIALDREQSAQNERIRAERRTLENHSIELSTSAMAAYNEGYTDLALLLSLKAVAMTNIPPLSEQTYRTIAQGPGIRAVLSAHMSPVRTISISPNKKMVISGGCGIREKDMTCKQGELIVLNIDGNASDLVNNQRFRGFDRKELNGAVNDVVFSPYTTKEGISTVLSADESGSVILWEVSPSLDSKAIRRFEGNAGAVNEVALSPDASQFLAAYDQGTIIFWDIASGKEIQRLPSGTGAATSVAFSQDGKTALSASVDGTTILWDVDKKTEIRRYFSPPGVWLTRAVFGPVDKYGKASVWGLSSDHAVYIWDLETANRSVGITSGSNPYRDIAFSAGGDVAALAYEGMILLKNPSLEGEEQRLVQKSSPNPTRVTTLAISPDDALLVSGDEEGNIELWNLPVRDDLMVTTINGVTSLGNSVLFPDGRDLLSTTGSANTPNPTLLRIDLTYERVKFQSTPLPNQIAPNGLAIDPKGRYILVGGGTLNAAEPDTPPEPFLWVLDADNGEVIQKLEGHHYNVMAVAISPDGRYALSGSANRIPGLQYITGGELLLWDMESYQQVRSLTNAFDIQGIAFSHSGNIAATCSRTGSSNSLIVWEIATGMQMHRYPYGCLDAVFSSDDKSILINALTESTMNWILQINVNNGEAEPIIEGSESPIISFDVSPSPDERYLFAASMTTAGLWDLKSGQELSSFPLPSPGANSWAVFPLIGDTVIIVQDNASQLTQWKINAMTTLENLQIWILKNRYIRPFTCEEKKFYQIEPLCDETGIGR